ncbi:MAG: PQQ-dependent sugar dehydrogenase [Candidatus Doudnabacteria bacterium]|nr:PQQ-dependent sugar dehydrogenase [Candidatus Doudnabacteria bacterium]
MRRLKFTNLKTATSKSIAVVLLGLLNFLYINLAFGETEADILKVPSDFRATKILDKLPLSKYFTFDFEGNFIFNQAAGGTERIVKVAPSGEPVVLVDRVSQPLLGLSFHQGKVYAIFRGRVDVVNQGSFSDLVTGLPASGDYANSSVIFHDGKMYFSVGTATNSGLVGADNGWLKGQPSVHDLPCKAVKINQINIETDNFLTARKDDKASTGSFMPFNTPAYTETLSGSLKCSGAIMRANPDGSNLELVAYGFHNPKGLSFDSKNNLYTLDSAMEDRGVRPVKDGRDSLFAVSGGTWHGWPDFNAGREIDNPIIKEHPNTPPQPLATFDPGQLSQFVISDFDQDTGLATVGGKKVSEFGLRSGKLKDFVTLAPDYRIDQIKFGPDNNLYAMVSNGKNSELWKVESTKHPIVKSGTRGTKNFPIAWSASLTITVLGFIATYLVWKNRQQPIG